MSNRPRLVAYSLLLLVTALYVVGAVSVPPGSLRHEVQTLPLWFPIIAGLEKSELAKWAALPCFIFWLMIMVFIWLFLLGWAQIVRGHFPPIEIAMTLVVGAASVAGLWESLRWRTAVRPLAAFATFVLFAALQVLALRISLFPYVAHR